jgi:hypothetical protein
VPLGRAWTWEGRGSFKQVHTDTLQSQNNYLVSFGYKIHRISYRCFSIGGIQMSKTKKILIVVVALVALLALTGSVFSFGQSVDKGNDPDRTNALVRANQNRPLDRLRRNWPGAENIDYDALLADALDITVEELQEAREEATGAALDQAVEEGVITQQQVDLSVAVRTLREAINRGELVSDALGITVEELQEARQNRAFRRLLADLEMTPAEVREAVLAEFELFVEQAVEDDLITDDQAELVLGRPGLVLRISPGPQSRRSFQGRQSRPGPQSGAGPAPQQRGRGHGFGFPAPF